MADPKSPIAFLSYSHDSTEHADRLLALAYALRDLGIDVTLDRYVHPAPAEGWPLWMERNLDEAQFVLMVCTETYRRRVMGQEEPGKGLGVRWEGRQIYNRIYHDKPSGSRFIPILLPGSEPAHIPTPVQGHAYYRITTFDLTDPLFDALYRHLTGQPATPPTPPGPIQIRPPKPRPPAVQGPLPPSGGPGWNIPYPRNMSADIFHHLCGIAILKEYNYNHKFFEREMYWLKDSGFIQTKPPNTDREFYEGINGKNLAEMWQPTELGWSAVKLRKKEIPPDLLVDPGNVNIDPSTLSTIELTDERITELSVSSMSADIFHHLCGIAILKEYNYNHKFFEREMYWLKDSGFIQTKPPNTDREFYEGINGKNLAEMWQPTELGRSAVKLRKKEIPPDLLVDPGNVKIDPSTLSTIELTDERITELPVSSMSADIFHHLCGIAILKEYNYNHKFFEREMYWLKDSGFIQTKPPNTDREFYEGINGKNLAEMWQPTELGRSAVKLRKKEIPPDLLVDPGNVKIDPSTL